MRILLTVLFASGLAFLLSGQPAECAAGFCAGACSDFCAGEGCFCLHNPPSAPGHCVGSSRLP